VLLLRVIEIDRALAPSPSPAATKLLLPPTNTHRGTMMQEATPEKRAQGWVTLKNLTLVFFGTVVAFRAAPFVLSLVFPSLSVRALGWEYTPAPVSPHMFQ